MLRRATSEQPNQQRQHRLNLSMASMASTASHRHIDPPERRHDASLTTASAFVGVVLLTVIVGLLSLSERSLSIPAWANSPHATCARVQRHGDSAVASVPIGTPPRVMRLLVRLDTVLEADQASAATTVFADELLRSETLRCDSLRCNDVAVLATSTTAKQERVFVEFSYGSAFVTQSATERMLGVDGSIRLVRGWVYALTRTHLCWMNSGSARSANASFPPPFDPDGERFVHALEATILVNESNAIATTAAAVARWHMEGDNPFIDAPASACNGSGARIDLFPAAAAEEQSWLALSSSFLFEASASKLDARREVVEKGLDCAPPSSEREVYQLDCGFDPYATCRSVPSIPFRRLSRYHLDVRPSSENATVLIRANFDVALSRISGALTVSQAVFFAAVRLCVLLIVAFVVYTRAERRTTSAFHMLTSALDVALGVEKRSYQSRLSMLTDGGVGLLAVASRLAVLVFQSQLLIADGHLDGVGFESVGVFASVLHFLLRNFVLEVDLSKESPVQKLGGSMALADAASAALFSVVSTPTLQASTRDFDAVARLFCGVLIAIFVLHRCWISVTACTLLANTTATDRRFDRAYPLVLWLAALLWSVQTMAVVFGFGRFFAVPQAYSIHRNWAGEVFLTESIVFFCFLSLGMPVLNAVFVKLVKTRSVK